MLKNKLINLPSYTEHGKIQGSPLERFEMFYKLCLSGDPLITYEAKEFYQKLEPGLRTLCIHNNSLEDIPFILGKIRYDDAFYQIKFFRSMVEIVPNCAIWAPEFEFYLLHHQVCLYLLTMAHILESNHQQLTLKTLQPIQEQLDFLKTHINPLAECVFLRLAYLERMVQFYKKQRTSATH